jgi:hypothetical protein
MDCVFFDGASNVQKAGRLLEAKYLQLTVLHGAEHVVSLFFADATKLKPVKRLIVNYPCAYKLFGLGAMHAPYALFQKQAHNFNDGRKIGQTHLSSRHKDGRICHGSTSYATVE